MSKTLHVIYDPVTNDLNAFYASKKYKLAKVTLIRRNRVWKTNYILIGEF